MVEEAAKIRDNNREEMARNNKGSILSANTLV